MIISPKKNPTLDGSVANIHDGFSIIQQAGVNDSTYISDRMYIRLSQGIFQLYIPKSQP